MNNRRNSGIRMTTINTLKHNYKNNYKYKI